MAKKILTNNQVLMKECIQQEFDESATYTDEAAYFEYFSAAQVLKNYNLSDDEIDSGLVGDGNDGGCDGIFVFLNGELITSDQLNTLTAAKGTILNLTIIQAKNTTSFKEDAIMKWKTASENMLNIVNNLDSFSSRYNEATREGFRIFREAVTRLVRSQVKIQIQYYYVTLASELHPNVEQQANELKDIIKKIYPTASVDVIFVDADRLMELYNTDSEISINLELADRPIALGRTADYVALVNLATYYRFITNDDGSLRRNFFKANVRDYQGPNAVNTSIGETLANNTKEDFWWLNNGVTILASKIMPLLTKELVLVDPEIVNGLQTSTEIYKHFSDNPLLLDSENRNILVRFIVPEDEESRDNIIFATNNQTNIPKSSLRVTDTIHLQIEIYFKNRGLYYDRRKNYYKNQKKKPADIIGVSFLAQCLISVILRKPDFARARPSTLLTDDKTYSYLYEQNKDLETYYKIALLGKKVQHRLKADSTMSPTERNDIMFYVLYGVIAKSMNKKEIKFFDFKGFDVEQITMDMIDEMKKLVFERYKALGGDGRVAKSSTFINEIDVLLGF